MNTDEKWMRDALVLARRGEGRTRPNPPVGAVVVAHDLEVGHGYHARAGAPHAEIAALNKANTKAKAATLYVTLEPCSTHGKTPPCVDAIISAGIQRVVVGVRDPNPKHKGRGLRMLRKAGVDVEVGVCAKDAQALIEPFSRWVSSGRPFITLKLGISFDGRIADREGRSKWITSPSARARVQELRARVDAVMVGCGTIRADNPSLLYRGRRTNHLYRVIVDPQGKTPGKSQVLNDDFRDKTVIAVREDLPESKTHRFEARGATVWRVPMVKGTFSMASLAARMGELGLIHVLCEGGGVLAAGLIEENLVDEYRFFVAPKIIGGREATPSVGGTGWQLPSAPQLVFVEAKPCGPDLFLRAIPAAQKKAAT